MKRGKAAKGAPPPEGKRGRRRGKPRGPLGDEVARWLPAATIAGALLLAGGSVLGFLHGQVAVTGALSRLALGAAASFAAGRAVLGVVVRYERRNAELDDLGRG